MIDLKTLYLNNGFDLGMEANFKIPEGLPQSP